MESKIIIKVAWWSNITPFSCTTFVLPRVSSTLDVVQVQELNLPQPGEWRVFWAWEQTRGQGQKDRLFFSPLGGLYLTVLMVWPFELLSPLASMVISFAAMQTLHQFSDLSIKLKWINDLYVAAEGRCLKIGGSLSSLMAWPIKRSYAAFSVGLNINSDLSSLSGDLPIVSLKMLTGRSVDLIQMKDVFLSRLRVHLRRLVVEDGASLTEEMAPYFMFLEKKMINEMRASFLPNLSSC